MHWIRTNVWVNEYQNSFFRIPLNNLSIFDPFNLNLINDGAEWERWDKTLDCEVDVLTTCSPCH